MVEFLFNDYSHVNIYLFVLVLFEYLQMLTLFIDFLEEKPFTDI